MKKWTTESSLSMSLVCYPESMDGSISSILDGLNAKYGIKEYAYILHDCDREDDGTLKKEHYHLYVKFLKRVSYSTIAKAFNINANSDLIDNARDRNRVIRYMTHQDYAEKYQYDFEFIHTYLINSTELEAICSNDVDNIPTNETIDFNNLLAYALSDECWTITCLTRYALNNGMFATFRRCYQILKEILKEKKI